MADIEIVQQISEELDLKCMYVAGHKFAKIDSGSMPGWTSYSGRGESAYLNTYNGFHLDILYGLAEIGVDAEIIESLIPKLYELYSADEELRTNKKNYRDFKKSWQSTIDRWKVKTNT